MTGSLRLKFTTWALTAAAALSACSGADKPKPDSAAAADSKAAPAAVTPSVAASAPPLMTPQERLAKAAQAVSLPTVMMFPAPEAMPRVASFCERNLAFDEPEVMVAWQNLLADADKKARSSNNRRTTDVERVVRLVREGRAVEARAATEALSSEGVAHAFLEAHNNFFLNGAGASDKVLVALSEAAPALSPTAVFEVLMSLAPHYSGTASKLGLPKLVGGYLCAFSGPGDVRYFSTSVAAWPITTYKEHNFKLISWGTPEKKSQTVSLQQLLVMAAAEARQQLDQPKVTAPLTKGEYEPSAQFEARLAKSKKLQEELNSEEIVQFLVHFSKQLELITEWTLGGLEYDADKQEFSGKVAVANSSTVMPVRFPTPLGQAPAVKKDLESAQVRPAFAVDGSGNLALISVQILGSTMHLTKGTDKAFSIGLNVAKESLADAVLAVEELKGHLQAEKTAREAKEREESSRVASHPQVKECLAEVQREYGTSSSGASGINVQSIQRQAAAIQRCHERGRTAAASGTNLAGTYLPAGQFMCAEQRDAMQAAFLFRSVPNAPLPSGCQYAGADIAVKKLRTVNAGHAELALVGNAGGAVWVDGDRLR